MSGKKAHVELPGTTLESFFGIKKRKKNGTGSMKTRNYPLGRDPLGRRYSSRPGRLKLDQDLIQFQLCPDSVPVSVSVQVPVQILSLFLSLFPSPYLDSDFCLSLLQFEVDFLLLFLVSVTVAV